MKYSFIFIFLLMALTGCKDSPNAKPAAGTETGVSATDPEGCEVGDFLSGERDGVRHGHPGGPWESPSK